ncbi:hypothetical protein EDC01DRAFT_635991 [Geopyxis carbonaria]|nr:hypothetical protein EDC01DRAFT_635991 [Geopyxis carbonaria]
METAAEIQIKNIINKFPWLTPAVRLAGRQWRDACLNTHATSKEEKDKLERLNLALEFEERIRIGPRRCYIRQKMDRFRCKLLHGMDAFFGYWYFYFLAVMTIIVAMSVGVIFWFEEKSTNTWVKYAAIPLSFAYFGCSFQCALHVWQNRTGADKLFRCKYCVTHYLTNDVLNQRRLLLDNFMQAEESIHEEAKAKRQYYLEQNKLAARKAKAMAVLVKQGMLNSLKREYDISMKFSDSLKALQDEVRETWNFSSGSENPNHGVDEWVVV